ncbi:hypothetical protein IFR35_06755 [Pseudomonas fluorescens]|uniref:hypothetical protein n=1 Tax=Pseudomonas fluorescens TaxID=294 RepID=UPI0017801FC0|nr:hypothetical protein [Pseudomonas fluorescens]MBD8192073.1 hypothetical protein [Pseudomonas fluorescens]MBD8226192.1 hypothetical protein [Pseudomonas fluorescens]MBD8783905.1 hypothetical protein [Pseudomonas fluorescens]MBD8819407.1 hypothetical protein [Pseudomonas fluorescens]
MHSNLSDFGVKGATFFSAMLWAGLILAAQENICDNEKALFQCQVRGGKNLALCPEYVDGEMTGIQYRFGREVHKELVFPNSSFDFKSFKSNHFTRYQIDYKRIKFSIGTYVYSLYSDYDGETPEGAARRAGVVVSNSSETTDIQIPCTTIYIDNFGDVFPHLKCDIVDALGCY